MALWIVRSWGGIETDQEGHYDPIVTVARHTDSRDGQVESVELIETHSEEGADFVRRQPHVTSVEPAHDGAFHDDDEGEILVSDGGRLWHPATPGRPAVPP